MYENENECERMNEPTNGRICFCICQTATSWSFVVFPFFLSFVLFCSILHGVYLSVRQYISSGLYVRPTAMCAFVCMSQCWNTIHLKLNYDFSEWPHKIESFTKQTMPNHATIVLFIGLFVDGRGEDDNCSLTCLTDTSVCNHIVRYILLLRNEHSAHVSFYACHWNSIEWRKTTLMCAIVRIYSLISNEFIRSLIVWWASPNFKFKNNNKKMGSNFFSSHFVANYQFI